MGMSLHPAIPISSHDIPKKIIKDAKSNVKRSNSAADILDGGGGGESSIPQPPTNYQSHSKVISAHGTTHNNNNDQAPRKSLGAPLRVERKGGNQEDIFLF